MFKTGKTHKAYIDFGIFSLYFIVVICKNFRSAKVTLMQIWKPANIFVFICAREICEKFVYKHLETIEYVKN